VRAGAAPSKELCEEDSPWSIRLLGPSCPLFACKFGKDTVDNVSPSFAAYSRKVVLLACIVTQG
jgi:hypothetical protein